MGRGRKRKDPTEDTEDGEGSAKKKSKRSRRTVEEAPDLDTLQEIGAASKKKLLLAENTQRSYSNAYSRGTKFLEQLIASKRAKLARSAAGQGGNQVEAEGEDLEELDLDLFAEAFGKTPNRYSGYALQMFIVQKCMVQTKKSGSGMMAYAAFKKYWEMLDEGKYRGPYSCDEATGKVSGNPAESPGVQDIYNILKNLDKKESGSREHAEAMKIDVLRRMMLWSEQQCPSASVSELSERYALGGPATLGDILHVAKHYSLRAYMSTGFVLWTRNNELCGLQHKHITLDCEGRVPHRVMHDKIKLQFRKGWTRAKGGEHAVTGHTYEIYDLPQTPELNVRKHLRQWLDFQEIVLLRRPPRPEDHVFPKIAVNGLVHPDKHMDEQQAGDYVNEFARAVGDQTLYSTHCFRRGGAQYRFMHCPIGERWSLAVIRWWGGWAEGESSNTLVLYLLDELHMYEKDHSDALCPIQREATASFNGDHLQIAPSTSAEVRAIAASFERRQDELAAQQHALAAQVNAVSLNVNAVSLNVAVLVKTVGAVAGTVASDQALRLFDGASSPLPHIPANTTAPSRVPLASGQEPPLPLDPQLIATPLPSQPLVRLSYQPRAAPVGGPVVGEKDQRPQILYPDAIIPDLPSGGKAWKKAIEQWNEINPATGYSLKTWPRAWYTGDMKPVTASKRKTRELINDEFERLGKDESKFLDEYPEATKGFKALLNAIRKAAGSRRISKYGTPEERDRIQQEVAASD